MGKHFLLFLFFVSAVSAQDPSKEMKDPIQKWREALSERKQLLEKIPVFEQKHDEYIRLVQEKQEKISENRKKISRCLHLLVRLGRVNPLRSLVDLKSTPYSIRGIILTRTLGRALTRHMKQVQADVNELQALKADLDLQNHNYQAFRQAIHTHENTLKTEGVNAVENVRKKEEERLASETNIHNLLQESHSVLSQKKTVKPQKPSQKNFPFDRLEIPVAGEITKDVTLQKKFSPEGKGIIFRTKKNAEVYAPAKGNVVFKGPFRSQGDILILNHGDHVHTVYIGLDKINVDMEQSIYAGEKIGTMAGYGKKEPFLYIELRHKGKPIEILPYLMQ